MLYFIMMINVKMQTIELSMKSFIASRPGFTLFVLSVKILGKNLKHDCSLFVLLLYVPSQQLWSWWDGQFT